MDRAVSFLKTGLNTIRQTRDRLAPPMAWRWPLLALAGLLSGLWWTLLGQLVQSQSILQALAALGTPALWLTALFWGLAVLAAAFLSHSLLAGNLIAGVPSLILAFVNYYKELFTSTPLTVGDFALIGQVGDIAGLNRDALILSGSSILAIVCAALWLIVSWFFSRPLRVPWRRSLLGAPACALVFCLLFWAGADAVIYTPMGIGLDQNRPQAVINAVCGAPLGLWRSVLNLSRQSYDQASGTLPNLDDLLNSEETADPARTDGPEKTPEPTQTPGSEETADPTQTVGPEETAEPDRTPEPEETPEPAQTAEPTQTPEPAQTTEPKKTDQPNIIMVLSESFFDITRRLEGVTFAQDPLPEFHAIQKESVSGTFYTRTLGYGTSNIELAIMTGLNTNLLSAQELYSYPPETFSRVPAVPALLRENGYYTSLVHTFNDSIYNRKTLFKYLGFDDMFFSGDFAKIYPPAAAAPDYYAYLRTRISGRYYSDDLLSDVLIGEYEKMSVEYDGPLFLYASSMEAHQPYPANQYSSTVEPVSSLTGEAADTLRIYSQAASNASAALGKLVDYFRAVDEPVIIVFFGDHRPGLGLSGGGSVYSKLGIAPENHWTGTPENFKELYSTDYLIWANDPSLLPGQPGSTWDTSCNYLGVDVLNLAKVKLPAYWQLIDRLSQTRVADMYFFFLDRAGNLSGEIAGDDPDAQRLDAWRTIVSNVLAGGSAPE